MNSKPVSSDRAQAFSVASWLFCLASKKRVKRCFGWGSAILLLVGCIFAEIQTSLLQSWFFTRTNKRLSYQLAAGRSGEIAFPRSAPFDDPPGLFEITDLSSPAKAQGYQVTRQVRQSGKMIDSLSGDLAPLCGTGRDRSRYPRCRRRAAFSPRAVGILVREDG